MSPWRRVPETAPAIIGFGALALELVIAASLVVRVP